MSRIFTLIGFISTFFMFAHNEPKITFKENKGQVGDQFSKPRPDVLFVGSTSQMDFYLRKQGISYQMYRVDSWRTLGEQINLPKKGTGKVPNQMTIYRLDINWLNVNSNVNTLKENATSEYENYYNEVCPKGITGVKNYKNVTYKNLYNGIDLKWYEKEGNLKYDYVVAPGVDHKQIRIEIKGADNISLGKNGELIIKTPLGTLEEKAPYVIQEGKVLSAKWVINKNVVSFDVIGVDPTKQLIIDPLVRLWGTFFGGNGHDYINDLSTDLNGNVYFAGHTLSQTNLATVGAHQATFGGGNNFNWGDAFLSKFTSSGVQIWTTYYGGNENDSGNGVDVDPSGSKIVMVGITQTTASGIISTSGAYQTNYAGSDNQWGDAFIVAFDANGVRQWGTYYGGSGGEWLGEVCFDKNTNDIYTCGATTSTLGIATVGAHQLVNNGNYDAFIVKLNSLGTPIWATYYGGDKEEYLSSCQVDKNGNVYLTGSTSSTNNISSPGSHQSLFGGGLGTNADGLFIKFNSAGVRQWSTYYGDLSTDWIYNCVLDAYGDIYLAGTTSSSLSPNAISTVGSHQSIYGGGSNDAFLAKFDQAGVRQWCTFYGGSGTDENNYCGIDKNGNIYLTGKTSSAGNNVIATPCSYQESLAQGLADIYLAKFTPLGQRLWSTYYGGFGLDDGALVNCDPSGFVYLTGFVTANSASVMTSAGAHQTVYMGGGTDAFIAKFDGCSPSSPINVIDPNSLNICMGDSAFMNVGSSFCIVNWFEVPQGGIALGNDSLFVTQNLTANTTFYVSEGSCGTDSVRTAITVTVNSPAITLNTPGMILCHQSTVALLASGANSYIWSPAESLSCADCADPFASPLQTTEYCVMGADTSGCKSTTCLTIEADFADGHNFSMPNAFTPNADGINDKFCLQGWGACNAEFRIVIFDRWGEKVYEATDPNFCWDGKLKGQLLNADVYIFYISAKYKDDTVVNRKGNITLIR